MNEYYNKKYMIEYINSDYLIMKQFTILIRVFA